MRNVRIRLLLNIAMVAGIGVTVGARTAERPTPIERQGEVTGNVVALSIARASGAFDVVLLLDEDEPGHAMDGRLDRGFLLQGALDLEGGLAMDLRGSRVAWDERAVRVWRAGTELLELRVMDAPVEFETQIAGIGLSHSTAWDVGIAIEGEFTPEFLAGLRTDIAALLNSCEEFDCRGGGPGSIGCRYSCSGNPKPCVKVCEEEEGYACCGCGTDGLCCADCRKPARFLGDGE